MMLQVYSVHDKAVGAFLPPFYVRARGEAMRSFADACNDPKHQFAMHAADYLLMYLGEFDDAAGVFVSGEPVRVISAIECFIGSDVKPSSVPLDARVNGR